MATRVVLWLCFFCCLSWGGWAQEFDFPETAEQSHGYRLHLILQGAKLQKPRDSFGSELAERYYTGTYTGKLRLLGRVNLIPHLLARGNHQLSVRIFCEGRQVAEFEQRLSEKKVTEFDVSTPPIDGQLEFFVHANRLGEDGVRVRGILEPTADADLLQEILRLYAENIPIGKAGNGPVNNLRSWFEPGLNEFRCGGYQGRVLKFLDELRFDPDPMRRRLLADFDYGPIEASQGNHQAVVIYPRGSDWTQTGIVLDPWPNQRPDHYTMSEWVRRFLLPRPSRVRAAEGDDHYPLFGKSYRQPDPTLTDSERQFIEALPAEQRAMQRGLDPWERKAWIAGARQIVKSGGHIVVDCPVEAFLTDSQGRITGLRQRSLKQEIPSSTVLHFQRAEMDHWYEMTFEPGGATAVELSALSEGKARVIWRTRQSEKQQEVRLKRGQVVRIPLVAPALPTSPKDQVLFDNSNPEGVTEGAPRPLSLRFLRPFRLNEVQLYHWNSGRGATPGTVSLTCNEDGKVYGPWPAQGIPGQGGTFWLSRPQVALSPGTYSLTCSSPSTWSYNGSSQGQGFATLRGHYTGPAMSVSDLVGEYRLTDLARNSAEYFADVRLLAGGQGWVREQMSARVVQGRYPHMADAQGYYPVRWSYDSASGAFVLDWSLGGKLPGLGRFAGDLSGQPTRFRLTGKWSSGKAATVELLRKGR